MAEIIFPPSNLLIFSSLPFEVLRPLSVAVNSLLRVQYLQDVQPPTQLVKPLNLRLLAFHFKLALLLLPHAFVQ